MATISIVMIVRDEAQKLRSCLDAARCVADELIIVDTGSVDETPAIARTFTDRVFTFPWCDDFAAARNCAVDHASGDWCLSLDADEIILNPDIAGEQLHRFTQTHSSLTLGVVDILSQSGPRDSDPVLRDTVSRLFCRTRFRFQGAIHEQLVPLAGEPVTRAATGVEVRHSGYMQHAGAADHKAHRNIPLLRKLLEEYPDDEYYRYQLGQAYFSIKDYSAAATAFEQALAAIRFDVQPPAGLRGTVSRQVLTGLVTSLCYAYINLGKIDAAEQLMVRQLSLAHAGTQRADFAHALGYLYFMAGKAAEAIEAYKLSLQLGPAHEDVVGSGSFASHYQLGLLYESVNEPLTALEHYATAVRINPGWQPAIRRCIGFITDYQTLLPADLFALSPVPTWEQALVDVVREKRAAGDTAALTLLQQTAAMIDPDLGHRVAALP